jgi:cyclic pyranopterin phosphate synthase
MPPEGVRLLRHEDILSYERIADVAAVAARLGFRKFRLTGGEPLARRGLSTLVSLLAVIPGVETLAMTTNGCLLAPVAAELKARGLQSVNVSLDTMNASRYAILTRGGDIGDAIRGIEAAIAAGLRVKLNIVVPSDGDMGDAEAVRAYAASIGVESQCIARYSLSEPKIDSVSCDRPPRCGGCDRLRLLADGRLRPCLRGAASERVDFADIEGSIRRAVLAKPERGLCCDDLAVGQIGG